MQKLKINNLKSAYLSGESEASICQEWTLLLLLLDKAEKLVMVYIFGISSQYNFVSASYKTTQAKGRFCRFS